MPSLRWYTGTVDGVITMERIKYGRDKNRKNDEYAVTERRKRVSELYLQGWPQWKIAEQFGVTQPTVHNDLKVIRTAWEATAILNWDEAKSNELAALDFQLEELWKAWYRSCEQEVKYDQSVKRELKTQTEGKGKDKKVVGTEMVVTESTDKKQTRQLIGDPRYMAEITKIRELRCRILGFLKDEKPQMNQTNIIIDWDALSKPPVDDIEERLRLEQARVVNVTDSAKDTESA